MQALGEKKLRQDVPRELQDLQILRLLHIYPPRFFSYPFIHPTSM